MSKRKDPLPDVLAEAAHWARRMADDMCDESLPFYRRKAADMDHGGEDLLFIAACFLAAETYRRKSKSR